MQIKQRKEPSSAQHSASTPLILNTHSHMLVASSVSHHPLHFGLSILKQGLDIISSLILQYVSPRDRSTHTPPKLTVTLNILFLVQFFLIAWKLHFCNRFVRTRCPLRLTLYLVDVSSVFPSLTTTLLFSPAIVFLFVCLFNWVSHAVAYPPFRIWWIVILWQCLTCFPIPHMYFDVAWLGWGLMWGARARILHKNLFPLPKPIFTHFSLINPLKDHVNFYIELVYNILFSTEC